MLSLSMAEPDNVLRPRISVAGVGGAGGNAINNMIRSSLEGCDFIAANTDSQALAMSLAPRKLQLGVNLSRGLGAGSKPDIGRAAAEEQLVDIMAMLEGCDMLFVTAGMGGGTGTGAAPVIARAARESGILTVGVVTKPFHFEGAHRMRQAESGIAELQQYVDTLLVIPNQNLFRIANERTTFAEAFRMADEVLHSGVRGITDLMVMPGFMNLDFADVKTVMSEMGKAMMGTGEADGENRAIKAAEAAISNPLLDDISMKGARGVLINITGGLDMTLFEMDQAANRIRDEVDPDAQIKVGSTLGEDLNGKIRVSVIATGIDAALAEQQKQRAASGSGGGGGQQQVRIVTDSAPTLNSNLSATRRAAPPQAATQAAPKPVAAAPVQAQQQQQQPVDTAPANTPNVASAYFAMPPAITPQQAAQQQTEAPVVQQAAPASVEPAAPPQQARVEVPPVAPVAAPPYIQARAAAAPQTISPVRQAQAQQPQQQRAAVQPAAIQRREPEAPNDMRVTQLTANAPVSSAAPLSTASQQRSQSLFQRITGFGMVRPSREDDDLDIAPAAVPQATSYVEDRAPIVATTAEQDMLDIPAFLRRQTNH